MIEYMALQLIINALVFWCLWRARKQGNGLSEDMDAVIEWIEARDREPFLNVPATSDLARLRSILQEAQSKGQSLALPSGTKLEILSVQPPADFPIPLGKHTLLVGLSGSGKSNTVSGYIIASLQACNTVWIIDSKDEHEQAFGQYARIFKKEEAPAAFDEAVSEGKRRRELFKAVSQQYGQVCLDTEDYYRLTGQRLEQITLVVEEMFDLGQSCDFTVLSQVLSTTRSAGINILGVVQYLNASVMPLNGSANFQVRVYMGAWNWRWVRQALGDFDKSIEGQLKAHTGPIGKAIIRTEDGKTTRAIIPLIPAEVKNMYLRGEV